MTTVSTVPGQHLADGPAMYFGGTIMTFALPLGAFIVISIALFFLFRSEHHGPKLKYLATASFVSVGTREPGPAPAPPVTAGVPETTADQAGSDSGAQETAEAAPESEE
jgi:hypothetical protein